VSERAAVVTREAATYRPDGSHSFFADLCAVHRGQDFDAAQRLFRHEQETGAVETRTNPNTTAGTGGEFAPPLWAIDHFQTVARAGRVLGDLVNALPLPPNVSSIDWPTMSTGADAEIQPANADAVTEVDEVTGTAPNTAVVTIDGEIDASQQLYDLSPPIPGYDAIAYTDLSRAYNANLEKQLLAGTGTNGQLTGVQNVAGRNADVVGTSATSVSVTYDVVGQAVAAIGNNRFLPAEFLLMAPRRWAWLTSRVDDSHRPIETPASPHPNDSPPAGGVSVIGRLLGKPVYEDGAIPAGTSADVIVALRASDLWLYESTPRLVAVAGSLGGTLQIRLQLRRYVNFQIPYPTALTTVTGIPAPANY
jgi:HK97 family phage major capsid protein